jgi:hypothetical protein
MKKTKQSKRCRINLEIDEYKREIDKIENEFKSKEY